MACLKSSQSAGNIVKHNHFFSLILGTLIFLSLALLLMPAGAFAASTSIRLELWEQLEGPIKDETVLGQTTRIPTLSITHTSDPYATSQVPLSSGFDFPVVGLDHEGFSMINCFGCGVDWLGDYGHTAEDYENGRAGDPVYAASEGVVLWRGVGPVAYGNVLIVQHNVQGTAVFTPTCKMSTPCRARQSAAGSK